MQFNRKVSVENFTTAIHQEADENTLVIEIKQKTTTASELNMVVKKFAEDNHIDELDSNTMQLITEELLVMVLLPMLPSGMPMQYFITCNRSQRVVKLAMGYPGTTYNPFEIEENIFMINIFREWIAEIQFRNSDNQFNELTLTINVKQTGSILDDLIGLEPEDDDAEGSQLDENGKLVSKSIFDPEAGKQMRNSVPLGELVMNTREDQVQILELLIRMNGITQDELYYNVDAFLEPLGFRTKRIMFDDRPTIAQASAKSVCKVVIFDLLEHFGNQVRTIEVSLCYSQGNKELILRLWYPGTGYNPFVHNKDSRGMRVLSRQKSITSFYAHKNEANMIMIVMEIIG